MTTSIKLLPRAVAPAVVASLLLVGLVGVQPQRADEMTLVAEPFDPEVVLPARVDSSLHRAWDAVTRSVAAVDDRRRPAARRALRAARWAFPRAHRAVLRQVQAVVDPEGESTAGPDSALASLNVSQASVASLAGLFDGVRRARLVRDIGSALATAQRDRAVLVAVVTGLAPEGAGAAYADALADTVAAYDDEVAGVQEALEDDSLTPRARTLLTAALTRSQAAAAAMTAAYGGAD